MTRPIAFLFVFLILSFFACKKDQLHFDSVQKINSLTDSDRLNKIIFSGDGTGYIAGGKWYVEAAILTSKDSGATWQRKAFPNVGQLLNSATISPSGQVYCTGFEGKLMHTYDAGADWLFNQLEHYWFRDIAFADAGHAIVVGGISFGSGLMLNIDSAGNVTKRDSFNYQLNQIKMVSSQVGYICGFGIVLKTVDGAKTWQVQNVQSDNFMAMDVHGDEIWMCGNNGCVFHTTDGGNHWTRQRNGNDISQARYRLMDILFTDTKNGWAVGENGVVLHSDDGGNHWMEYDHFTNSMLISIAKCPDGNLMVAGENGSIYKLIR